MEGEVIVGLTVMVYVLGNAAISVVLKFPGAGFEPVEAISEPKLVITK
jgi:hypothetical protein